MRIIIDIPEEVKREFDKTESIALKGAYFDLDGIIGKAIQNGIPLDKIRKEVMEYIDDLDIAYEICGVFDNIGKAEKGGE